MKNYSEPNRRPTRPARRPSKWTWLELTGLSAAFFLIIFPMISLVITTIAPPVAQGAASFSITKSSGTATGQVGQSYDYIITITATQPGADLNTIFDQLPSEVSIVSAYVVAGSQTFINSAGISINNGANTVTFTGTGTTFPLGQTASVGITVQINAGATGTYNNTATVTDQNGAPASFTGAPVTVGSPVTSVPPVSTGVSTSPPVTTPPTSPSLTSPAVTSPAVTSPAVTSPAVTSPAVTSPAVTSPAVTSPAVTSPVVTSPAVTSPVVSSPAVTSPAVTSPAITSPAVTSPAVTSPSVTSPGVTSPAITSPSITSPSVTSPSITSPTTATTIITTPATTTATTTTSGTPIATPTATTVVSGPGETITAGILPTRGGPIPGSTATPVPGGGGGTSPAPTNTSGNPGQVATGVITGVFTVGGSGAPLNGNRVDLILRSGGADRSVANSLIDSTGQYAFLSVRSTNAGEVYFVRFSNPNGGNTLRVWNSSSFTFGGGRAEAPRADLIDVALGNPGSSLNTFQLPLTLNWSSRGQGDNYSVTVYRSDGSGVALSSGNLGGATAYTIATSAMTQGDYFAEVGVSNGSGAGTSQRQFRFRVGSGNTLLPPDGNIGNPTTTAGSNPTTAAASTPTPSQPTPTTNPIGGGSGLIGGNTSPTARPNTIAPSNTRGIAPVNNPAVAATTVAPTANPVVNAGNGPATTVGPAIGGGQLPGGTASLPQSGGELPLLGLSLAALTLILRRVRLVLQTPKAS